MAWFEGLSSLKGQLSNLAKGVLTDDTEEDPPTSHDQSTPSQNPSSRPETSTASPSVAPEEGWNGPLLATDTFIGQDAPTSTWNDVPMPHPAQSPQPGPSRQEGDDGSVISKGFASLLSFGAPDLNDQLKALQEENRILREDNESKAREIRSYTRIITDLESTVAVGQDVNSNLSTGMEELDLQHQQAIEQVLTDKEDTQKQYEQLQLRYAELESRFVEMEKELNKPKPQFTCSGTDPPEEHEADKEDLLRELEVRDKELELVEQENERLNELVKILNADLDNAREALPSIPENSEELELRVSALEGDNLVLREVRTNLETEVAASRGHISELSRRVNELNAMLKNQENVMIDYNKLTETNSQKEQQLTHNRSYIEKLEKDLLQLREESVIVVEGLKSELADKKAYIERLEEGSEASKLFLQDENAKIDKKIAEFKKLSDLVLESDALKEEFNAYKSKAESDYKLLETELHSLKQNEQGNELTQERVKMLERELESVSEKAKNFSLELKLMKGNEELQSLEIQSLNETKEKLEKELSDNRVMEATIVEQDQTITSLEMKCKAMESAFEEDRKNMMIEVDSLRNSLSEFQIYKDLNRETVLELKKQLEEKEDELFKQSELYFGKLSQMETEICAKDKENIAMAAKLKELEISMAEMEKNIKQLKEDASEIEVIKKEKADILEETKKLKNELELFRMTENQVGVLVARNKEYASKLEEEDEKNRSLQNENDELRRSLELKHAESFGYNSEIQRLNNALQLEISKSEKLAKDNAQITNSYAQLQCQVQEKAGAFEQVDADKNKQISALTQEVETLKNQLEYVSHLLKSVERGEGEGQGETPPQQKTCANGCAETQEELGRLTAALLREQTENKLLKNSVDELNEKLSKDNAQLVMLKEHLFGIEETYTNELMVAQNKIDELSSKLSQADDRARTSSTAYTSANIRANQQVESLSQQVRLLTEHKEKLEGELSLAEDNYQKQSAAITNLQAVLHQFQRDKQSDIEFETERMRQKLAASNARNEELQMEMKVLQEQLVETKKGLAAANRLSDQLDLKVQLIESLTSQVNELNFKLKAEEAKVQAAYTNVEGKVDRNLVKNLVTGYVCSPPNSKLQVLKVIAQVLDLNREDRIKMGLEPGTSAHHQSLSEAFIRFLESESQPKPIVPLSQPNSTPPSRKTSQSGPVTLLLPTDELPTMPHFSIGRHSAGSILKDVMKESNA
uniref:Thyroid receptor-interacting protein 11 n=1 Tax=Lygus hesperus TaxID=30085 RepID=A0A0A9XQN1_LYGHE